MSDKPPVHKRILIDIAGICLIILAMLLGWLPGPGGVPLLLAGLGLLSINHHWARRLRDYFVQKGTTLWQAFFVDDRRIQIVYDLLTVVLLVGVYLCFQARDRWWGIMLLTVVFFADVALFLGNRKRAERLGAWYKKRFKHKH